MKNTILKFTIFITLILQINISTAQIRGNGQVITQDIEVKPFEKLNINFPIKLTLDANADYALTIITDKNILPEIVLENTNNQLSILQDKWIEPSRMVEVKIGTKGLTTFTISGYGTANIFNLDENQLILNNGVGKVMLSGKVNTLIFSIKTGNLNAAKLETQHIKGNISSHGKAMVNAKVSIEAEISDNGKLVYLEKPETLRVKTEEEGEVHSFTEEQLKKEKVEPVKYVKVKLRNNRYTRIHTYVKRAKESKV